MNRSLRPVTRLAAAVALVAVLTVAAAPAAGADDWARDRAAVTALHGLDPAIRAAIAARSAEAPTAPDAVVTVPSAEGGFAWGAAALGLGVGAAAMCVLLGCVTLVRNDGRLRSA